MEEKLNIETGKSSVLIPKEDGSKIECKIIAPLERVDDMSVHVITDKGVFLFSIEHIMLDGESFDSVDALELKIPEKRQTNPN